MVFTNILGDTTTQRPENDDHTGMTGKINKWFTTVNSMQNNVESKIYTPYTSNINNIFI